MAKLEKYDLQSIGACEQRAQQLRRLGQEPPLGVERQQPLRQLAEHLRQLLRALRIVRLVRHGALDAPPVSLPGRRPPIIPTVPPLANSTLPLASARALLDLAAIAESPLRFGNAVRILRDGALAFPAMLAAIRAARTSVCFENFILADDGTGAEFARALEASKARGTRVRVLYDPVGTLLVRGGSVARRLRPARIEARAFRPLSPLAPWSWIRLRHRDHRKLLICDARNAVIGTSMRRASTEPARIATARPSAINSAPRNS